MSSNVQRIAMFPLSIIVLPGEEVPLRIFEPRYKQLISECEETSMPFGIPYIQNSKITELGSEVKLSKVVGKNANGEMVIMIRGISLFTMVDFIPELPDKLYGGGVIETIDNDFSTTNAEILALVKKLRIDLKPDISTLLVDNSINMLDVAKALMLKSKDKVKLITADEKKLKEQLLINQLRFVELIQRQENKLENNFQLN